MILIWCQNWNQNLVCQVTAFTFMQQLVENPSNQSRLESTRRPFPSRVTVGCRSTTTTSWYFTVINCCNKSYLHILSAVSFLNASDCFTIFILSISNLSPYSSRYNISLFLLNAAETAFLVFPPTLLRYFQKYGSCLNLWQYDLST